MKNTKEKLKNQSKIVKSSFQQVDVASSLSITQACLREADKLGSAFVHCNISGSNITKYSGLNTVAKYMNRQNIVKSISTSFPTVWHNATRFGINQILMAIMLSSISGIRRVCKIAAFSGDGLVKALLKLDKGINENAISTTLKKLGQSGARKLLVYLGACKDNQEWASNRN